MIPQNPLFLKDRVQIAVIEMHLFSDNKQTKKKRQSLAPTAKEDLLSQNPLSLSL
jgi:hypothetical protein